MWGGKVKKLVIVALIGAAVAAIVRALRGEPTPVFSNHPTVTGGPAPTRVPADVPSPTLEPEAAPVPAPTDVPTEATSDEPEPDGASRADTETRTPGAEQAWVDPVDGACPDGYPIKAKVKSGIYHRPGTATYERTKPDRCYPSTDAAEADGLRPPKR